MRRYNWEYNGEKMGLIERQDGICVLWSDVEPLLNQDVIALQDRIAELEEQLKMRREDTHDLCDGGCAEDECVCVSRFAVQKIDELEGRLEQAEAKNKRLIAMVKSFEPVPQGHTDEGDAMLSALAQLEQAIQGGER